MSGRSLNPAILVCAVVVSISHLAYAHRGRQIRFESAHGPVRVWTPAQYDRDTAGIVIYVHGYFTDLDRAWKEHQLPAQFAESGINVFVACEAPDGPDGPIRWANVNELLDAVTEQLGEPLPDGRVIAIGHSGAHRTLTEWLDDARLDTVVLVDALYGEVDEFRGWLDADSSRRLINASALTKKWAEELTAGLPDTLVFERFPPATAGKLEGARLARVVYVRSQHDHMDLVTGGVAIPMLLRAVDLPLVGDRSRKAPIHAL